MTIRSRMISIMGVIRPEQLEQSYLPLNSKNFYISLCLHCSIYKYHFNQLVPNLVKIYMTLRSRMSSIMGVIRPEQPEQSYLPLN